MKRKSQAGIDRSRASFSSLSLAQGKRVRLWRLLYAHGPANGTLMVLPLDQGLEHGPTDFFPNPPALDTSFQVRLAARGRLLGDRPRHRPRREVHARARGRGAAHPEAQRQDEHRRRRRGHVSGVRHGRGRRPPRRRRRRLHRLRRLTAPGDRDPRVRHGAPAMRAARHAARGVGLPARPRHRGEGRQGQPLRAGLRGARRRGARRRRREAARARPSRARARSRTARCARTARRGCGGSCAAPGG